MILLKAIKKLYAWVFETNYMKNTTGQCKTSVLWAYSKKNTKISKT